MKKNLLTLVMAAIVLSACNSNSPENNNKQEEVVIGKAKVDASSGRLTPEILHQFAQLSGVDISPDGKTVLYGVSYGDIELNKRNRELFTVNVDGSNKKQITQTPKSEGQTQWIKNGEKIAFIYGGQIWEMNPDGSGRKQISNYDGGIEGFKFSPDGSKVLFISQIKSFKKSSEIYPDLPNATGLIIDDLMYKHWDEWVETIPHPFVADFDGQALSNITDIMDGEPYEAPMKPFGDISDMDWAPNGKVIAYTSKKQTGKEYALSTNSDIYFYSLESKETWNVTEGNMGYDVHPKFSPKGDCFVWLSMERDGYESDKNRLMISGNVFYAADEGFASDAFIQKRDLTKDFDFDVSDYCWSKDGKTIYFVSNHMGTYQLFAITGIGDIMESDWNIQIEKLTEGLWDYASVALADGNLVGLRRSMSNPPEVFAFNLATKEHLNLSDENTDILNQITMGKVEERWVKTTDNKEMLVWVIYPPFFDETKQYPALLYCQGGPQNSLSQTWSVRWNHQIMAANDYIVVAPNRRGVPGFGQEWKEQISGDYPGQNMQDYLSAIDAVAKEPFVDENRLGATGASYGGYSVYWLAGNHNKRFKAFLAHAGVFNQEAKYLETEEIFFANWDIGGPYWEKDNKIAQRTYANSPHRFVDKWDTPIMITHGELDYRILASQGMMAFDAAQLRGIPSRMLIFPDENHWILQPQNAILFQREFFRWFDEFLK